MIYWKLCKKLKFDLTNKWYFHNLESVLENETHKILWDFKIQTDHLISARRPTKKRTYRIVEIPVPADHWVKLKKNDQKDKYQDLVRELKKSKKKKKKKKKQTLEHESDGVTKCNWYAWYSRQRIDNGTGRLENKRTWGDHPNDIIIKISPNTEKSSGNLRRLAVTQTPVEDHQLTLVWKTLKIVITIIVELGTVPKGDW